MAGGTTLDRNNAVREDPLIYLPRKGLTQYRRGQIIFDQNQPCDGLHLVVHGRVKVSAAVDAGSLTVIGIYTADEFFGENGLLGLPRRGQSAAALENTTLMSWTTAEVGVADRPAAQAGYGARADDGRALPGLRRAAAKLRPGKDHRAGGAQPVAFRRPRWACGRRTARCASRR